MSHLLPCQEEQNMALFFGESKAEQRKAAAMCAGCPFLEECKASGANEEFGVWGGVIEWDRPEAKRRAQDRRYREAQREAEREERGEVRDTNPYKFGKKRITDQDRLARNERIIALRASGVGRREVAQQFGLHENMVSRICQAERLGA